MDSQVLLPHLFRTEYRKIVSVLSSLFGMAHIEVAEDITSDTFLAATETWALNGLPPNPTAWLYTVAKNKTINYLRRDELFHRKLAPALVYSADRIEMPEIDLSPGNIADSQLAMMFTLCNPLIPTEAQVALTLNLLCGFGIPEIAEAYLTSKDVIYKRLTRAKEKLKAAGIRIEQPGIRDMEERLETVLTAVYLLFSEGYHSVCSDQVLRKDMCDEAMRLCRLLMAQPATDLPATGALYALMCFHASRFAARTNGQGETILYDDQDDTLWDKELIESGQAALNRASSGTKLSRYHLEAGIAYWHTLKEHSPVKWEQILDLYNQLLVLEYSPVAALNRTYALAQVYGAATAIREAENLRLVNNPFYFSLLGKLYAGLDKEKAREHYRTALQLSHSPADRTTIEKHLRSLQ